MTKLTLAKFGLIALVLTQSLFAKLDVATLNCYFYFSPANKENTGMERAPMEASDYARKTENLASLIIQSDAEFVGLQEVGSKLEASDLAAVLTKTTGAKWQALFVQGKDHYTGQDVAALVRLRPGLRVTDYGRVAALEKLLSKHMVVALEADGTRYDVCVVHLIRPIGDGAAKQAAQVGAVREWVTTARSAVVVLGDFNSTTKNLLLMPSANLKAGWPNTHLSNKSFDYIYGTRDFEKANVIRPPYGPRPNDSQKTVWTDHFLLAATVP